MGVAIVAYSPLGNPAIYSDKLEGMSSGLIKEVAEEAGLTPAQVMLNFLIAQDIIVVPKSVTPERIESNINFEMKLTSAQIERLALEAPQKRLANPRNRPGGQPVFVDEPHGRKEL